MIKRTVMIVDDESRIREVVAEILGNDDYELIVAPDGEEALRLLRTMSLAAPCVVVTDLRMPRMDGRQLAHAIRSDERFVGVRVLMLSSAATEFDLLHTDAFLPKPFHIRELRATVYHLFAQAA